MNVHVVLLIAELGYLDANVRLINDSNEAWNSNSIKMGYASTSFLTSGIIYIPYTPLLITQIGKNP